MTQMSGVGRSRPRQRQTARDARSCSSNARASWQAGRLSSPLPAQRSEPLEADRRGTRRGEATTGAPMYSETTALLLSARLRSRGNPDPWVTADLLASPLWRLLRRPLLPPCLRCCSGVPGDPPPPLLMRATARMFRGICSPTLGQLLPWVTADPPPCSGPDGTPGGGRAREGAGPTLARKK
jgi:hypothetical protein